MKIRSIFRFAVMVSLVLAVFAGSFALANTEQAITVVRGSVDNESVAVELSGPAGAGFASVNSDDTNNVVTFSINTLLEDNSWFVETIERDGKTETNYFLQMNVTANVPSNASITQCRRSVGNWYDTINVTQMSTVNIGRGAGRNRLEQEPVRETFTFEWLNSAGETIGSTVVTAVVKYPAAPVPGNHSVKWNGDSTVKAILEAAQGTQNFSDKVDVSVSGNTFIFNVNDYIENAFTNENGRRYIRYEILTIAPDNSDIKKLKVREGDWSDEWNVNAGSTFNFGGQIRHEDFEYGDNTVERTQTYTYLDEDGQQIGDSFDVTVRVVYPYVATPVPSDRIVPSEGGRKSDGQVLYQAKNEPGGVTTTITAPQSATHYAYASNVDEKNALTSGGLEVSNSFNDSSSLTILWYKGTEVSESASYNYELLKVESLDIGFYTGAVGFEPVPVEWLTPGTFEGLYGVSAECFDVDVPIKKVQDESGDTVELIDGPVTFTFNMDEENWKNAFSQSVSTEEINWPFGLIVPYYDDYFAKAVQVNATGINTPDDEALVYLRNSLYKTVYNEYDCQLDQFTEIATITYDGEDALITPKELGRSYMFKWLDSNNQEHFHRVDVVIKHDDNAIDSVKVSVAAPAASRLTMNADNLANIKAKYDDGTVVYMPEEMPASNSVVATAISRPDGIDAVKVKVLPQSGEPLEFNVDDNTPAKFSMNAYSNENMLVGSFRLEWMDEQGNILKREIIAIQVLPTWMDIWMDDNWAPVNNSNMFAASIQDHISYEKGIVTFKVNEASVNNLDVDKLCEEGETFYIQVPENATHIKTTSQHSPLYGGWLADETGNILADKPYVPIDEKLSEPYISFALINGERCLAVNFGEIFKKTKLANDNLSIYTVDDSLAGYADMLHIQWYEYDDAAQTYKLIQRNDKDGEYICMVKEPYMQTHTSGLYDDIASITPKPGEAYAIVWECDDENKDKLEGLKFRCEVPLQKNTHGNHRYTYQKLDLIDAKGKVAELPEGTTIKVVLPYPEGLNKDNTKLQHFDVWHYEDESLSKHESMRQLGVLALEDIGVTFITDSFSPFLLRYEPSVDSGNSSSGSGISIAYNGGNSFSTSNSAVPTSVEIDGIPVSFTGDGRSFTVNSIPAGAKWITVRWNSTSITTNFDPDGNVVSAGIEIPKTGDKPIWTAVAAFFGF